MRFMDDPEAAVLAAAKDMLRRGLVEGTAGNISARREDGNLVITPSSVDYGDMTIDDLVVVDADGAVVHAADGRNPSSEMQLHLACYRAFEDIGSVIHSPSGVGHHVRRCPPTDSGLRRRVRRVLRR